MAGNSTFGIMLGTRITPQLLSVDILFLLYRSLSVNFESLPVFCQNGGKEAVT
jgi:hypothetical protein